MPKTPQNCPEGSTKPSTGRYVQMSANAFVARILGIRYWFFSNADQSTAEVFAMRRTVRHDVNRIYGRNVFFLVLIALIMTAITVGSVYLFDYWAGYTKVGLP